MITFFQQQTGFHMKLQVITFPCNLIWNQIAERGYKPGSRPMIQLWDKTGSQIWNQVEDCVRFQLLSKVWD
jgi:hypothetical protein